MDDLSHILAPFPARYASSSVFHLVIQYLSQFAQRVPFSLSLSTFLNSAILSAVNASRTKSKACPERSRRAPHTCRQHHRPNGNFHHDFHSSPNTKSLAGALWRSALLAYLLASKEST
jgi:hypothetical protein